RPRAPSDDVLSAPALERRRPDGSTLARGAGALPHRLGRALGRRRRPPEHVAAPEQDGTGAAPRPPHAPAQVRQVLIGVDDVTLGGLSRHVIVSTVVESDPETSEPFGPGDVGPPHT